LRNINISPTLLDAKISRTSKLYEVSQLHSYDGLARDISRLGGRGILALGIVDAI